MLLCKVGFIAMSLGFSPVLSGTGASGVAGACILAPLLRWSSRVCSASGRGMQGRLWGSQTPDLYKGELVLLSILAVGWHQGKRHGIDLGCFPGSGMVPLTSILPCAA